MAPAPDAPDAPDLRFVRTELDGGIGRLTLAQPDRLNPLGTHVLEEVAAAARWFDQTDAAVVVVAGEGRAFSAGFDRRESLKRARAVIDKVGLLNREKANPVSLSGGEQQRLCIARALVSRPALLLADEPTGNLDAGYAADIMAMFRDFHQVGTTLVIATHDERAITALGGRTLHLDHGRIGGVPA